MATEAEPPTRGGRSWFKGIVLGLALLLALASVAGFVIRVPYTTIAPGEALSLPPLVTDQGAKTYPSPRGDIRLLFVREAGSREPVAVRAGASRLRHRLVKDGASEPGQADAERSSTSRACNRWPTRRAPRPRSRCGPRATRWASRPGSTVSDLSPGMPAIKTSALGRRHPLRRRHKISRAERPDRGDRQAPVGEQVDARRRARGQAGRPSRVRRRDRPGPQGRSGCSAVAAVHVPVQGRRRHDATSAVRRPGSR